MRNTGKIVEETLDFGMSNDSTNSKDTMNERPFWGTMTDYRERGETVSTTEFGTLHPAEYAMIGGVYFSEHAVHRMWPTQYTRHLHHEMGHDGQEGQKTLPGEYRSCMRVEETGELTYAVKNADTKEIRYIEKGDKPKVGEEYVLIDDEGRGIGPESVLAILNSCKEIEYPSNQEERLGVGGNPVFYKDAAERGSDDYIYIDDQVKVVAIKKNGKIAVKTVIFKSDGWRAKDRV